MSEIIEQSAVKAFDSLKLPQGNITPEMLDELEATMFELIVRGHPAIYEVDIPTTHTFTKFSYVREGVMPAGSVIVGHFHKEPHHCVVLSGHMTVLNADRTTVDIIGPATFYAGPGRKIGYMHTDVVMQNIHPRGDWPQGTEDDVEKVEEHIYKRTDAFKKYRAYKLECGLKKSIT